jgi:hypothetical protein
MNWAKTFFWMTVLTVLLVLVGRWLFGPGGLVLGLGLGVRLAVGPDGCRPGPAFGHPEIGPLAQLRLERGIEDRLVHRRRFAVSHRPTSQGPADPAVLADPPEVDGKEDDQDER